MVRRKLLHSAFYCQQALMQLLQCVVNKHSLCCIVVISRAINASLQVWPVAAECPAAAGCAESAAGSSMLRLV
jgi:hypothetical protein